MTVIEVRTERREQFVDVTQRVAETVTSSGVAEGIAHIWCPHTTAAVTVNEAADPSVARDIVAGLARFVPREAGWQHAEGNADAHVKASLLGASASVPVSGGRLALGTWQGVFFCEFDGPRTRRIEVRVSRL
ncbi:MAG: YjbQ family protein [Coriobacteriia bacterium]|nr:YjbQ family protein [Coriobacteriia bacterium]